jgi:hypothetical protein
MMSQIPTAFPWSHGDMTCTGMTLRDYFAANAMQALISLGDKDTAVSFSEDAYLMADAMLKARQK